MKCPKCGSRKTAPILYGMPAYDSEMQRKIENKKLVLGGCCISGMDPRYHCFGCGKDFGKPPILVSKYGEEDYREIVRSVRFVDGGYLDKYKAVTITKMNDKITLEVTPNVFASEASLKRVITSRELTSNEWKKLLNQLYCKLYLHEWKKTFNDPTILDGEQWELKIKLSNGRVRKYSGNNAFPPYWKELKAAFRPFFEEAGY